MNMDGRTTLFILIVLLGCLTASEARGKRKRSLRVEWKAFHWPHIIFARKTDTEATGKPCGATTLTLTTPKGPSQVNPMDTQGLSPVDPKSKTDEGLSPIASKESSKPGTTLASVTRKSRAADPETSCPGSFIQSTVGNFCFMTSMRRLSFTEAKAYCSKNKGILVSVESKDKHQAVVTFLKRNHFGSDATFWLAPIGNNTKKYWLSNMAPVNFENFKENTVSLVGSCTLIGLMDEKWMKQSCKSVLSLNHQNITNTQYVVCQPLNTSSIFNNLINSGIVTPKAAKNIASAKGSLAIMEKIKYQVAQAVQSEDVQEPDLPMEEPDVPTESPPQNSTSLWNRFKSFIGR